MEVIVKAIRQSGLAPKVKIPAAVLLGLGVVLTAIALIDDSQEGLLEVGLALIAAFGVTLGAGAAAPPGDVVVSPSSVAAAESRQSTRPGIYSSESGQSWVTFLFALAAIAIIVFVAVALVD